MRLEVKNNISDAEIAEIRAGLSAYNVAKVPALLQLPHDDFVVVFREEGEILGGAVCNFDWGWLFFDNVFLDERLRGKGYGKIIMQAAESYAAQKGVNNAYLFTTGFQAKPFYLANGYHVFGENPDRPRGYTGTYLYKTNLLAHPIDRRISLENPPNPETVGILDAGLLAHAANYVPIVNKRLGVLLRDESGALKGGIAGGTFWNWFDLRYFWLDESLRGQGWGKQLLQAAEAEARARDCVGILCDTASFQSLDFYRSQGFEIFGRLKGRPPQHESYFLQKLL
jgi:GNAT superfamily N-acetyltransferase